MGHPIERRRKARPVMRHGLLICNGEVPSKALARQLSRDADIVVAADGGANVARVLGIRPDVIIGDLDSITRMTKKFYARGTAVQFIRVTRQDNTDIEKALDFLLEQKVKRVTIIAATGNRLDHTLGNLSVIWNYTKNIEIAIVGEGFVALPVTKRQRFVARKGTTVSLVPFGTCSGITLKGLFYPLSNARMKVGEIGVSNVVAKSPFSVEVRRGKMLMIVLAEWDSIKAY